MTQPPPQKPGLRLGDLLVRAGYVTQTQVEVALHAASEQGCRIGTALVRLGYLDTVTLGRALGKLRGIRWLEPAELSHIDLELVKRLPAQSAHHRRVLPVRYLRRDGHRPDVLVAFDTPPEVDVLDEVAFVLGAGVTPCITPEDVLDEALDRYYPMPKPASYRMVDLEPAKVAVGGAERSTEAILRDCHAELEVHHDGCVLLVDREHWRNMTSRKPVTAFVIDYVRRHHDPAGQLTVRCHRQRHLLAHFTGHGRPVDARREPPGTTLGQEDPLFHQRVNIMAPPSAPVSQPNLPPPRHSGPHSAPPMSARSRDLPPAMSRDLPPARATSRDLPRANLSRDVPRVAGKSSASLPAAPRVVAGSPMRSRPDPVRAAFEEPPPPPPRAVAVERAPNPTHRDSVRVTPIDPTARPPSNGHEVAPPRAPPPRVPEESAKPKVELPAFPAPANSILTAEPDGLQDSLQRALGSVGSGITAADPLPPPPKAPRTRPPPLPVDDEAPRSAPPPVPVDDGTPAKVAPAPVPPALDFAAVPDALHGAKTSADVADVIVDALAARYEAVLVLVVKHDSAMGWRGRAPNVDADMIESVLVPLSEPSVLARAKSTRRVVVESPDDDEQAVHKRLWKALRLSTPAQVAAAPVELADRVVNILYVHPKAGAPLPDNVHDQLSMLAEAAQEAFARLIKARKDG